VRFNDRKEWLFDTAVFSRYDTQIALKIQAEFVRRHSACPAPRFFEVDRSNTVIDPVWHVAISPRTGIARQLDIPAIHYFDKPNWQLTAQGLVPKRTDRFWLAQNILREESIDYFPERGDYVFFNGYRYAIINVVLPPEAYWGQTNVWMGLYVECAIVPEGDASPLQNLNKVAPVEMGAAGPLAAAQVRS
jgi:hypothetical protein